MEITADTTLVHVRYHGSRPVNHALAVETTFQRAMSLMYGQRPQYVTYATPRTRNKAEATVCVIHDTKNQKQGRGHYVRSKAEATM